MVVTIDGPASSGKSSLASCLSRRFGFFNLNSGSFYRAMALKMLESDLNLKERDPVLRVAEKTRLELKKGRLFMDGRDVEDHLRSDVVDLWSSSLSTLPELRSVVNAQLRLEADRMDLVAEGRDMGTVVFPDAELKFYLDAEIHIRAGRRCAQKNNGTSLAEIEQSIRERDERDRSKKEGALKIPRNAVVIDSTALTLQDVCDKVTTLITNFIRSSPQE